MQLPYQWINEYVDIPWPAKELAQRLTLSGAEAESEQPFEGAFDNIVIGQIVEIETIEGTDHLQKAVVDIGDDKLQVVCGAPNAAADQKIILAKIGAKIGDGFIIKKAKLRGVESCGMICSERELNISDDHSGIIVLDDDAPIGAQAGEYLGLNDHVLEFDLTPNRMDMLCAIGVARDIACLSGQKVKRPDFELVEEDEKADDYIKISIDDADACPRYGGRVIKNVKIGPSPWWIKRKLILSGIRPISNIVDITNIVMIEYGQPLHAFDYDKITSKEILVRRARDGEKFTTLDDQQHTLTPDVLLITDGTRAVATGGVMGGLESEVSKETVNILLEAAYFDMVTIRKSRMKLGINSEASHRFERGMDPNIIPEALNRAAYLMSKYADGKVLSGIVDCYPQKISPNEIEFRPERANAVLGTNITRERMIEIFRGLEMTVKDEAVLKVSVPTWQPEITREVDLIEEIVRIEGFDSIESLDRNNGPLYTPIHKDDRLRFDVRSALSSQGYDETYGIGLADSKLLSKLTNDAPQAKILNPIAEDLNVMQNSLNYSLLKSISHNIAHRNINLTLFEIGKIFSPGEKPVELEQLGIAISGKSPDNWYENSEPLTFYDLKGALDALTDLCQLPPIEYSEQSRMPYQDDFSFILKMENKIIGSAGQIKVDIAKLFDIKQTVLTAIVDFDLLLKMKLPIVPYKPLPRFPAAPRDLAIVIDESVKVGDILEEIYKVGTNLLKDVEIFDVYRGKQVGKDRKSIAFSLLYRSDERSLKSKEVEKIQEVISNHLRKSFNAEIREG